MKRQISLFIALILTVFITACNKKEGFKKELQNEGYKAVITSNKPLHIGINIWKIKIYSPDGKPLTGAKVYINGYMPPMPGMPEMSFDYPVEDKGNYYEAKVNLSMAGTWQITIKAEKNGKTTTFKFGFNL
ncbi:MAG: hypothetical protein GXO22_05555 [Aquificae bacterium]|nr:hypothetical protein [Aquificota bacterium]